MKIKSIPLLLSLLLPFAAFSQGPLKPFYENDSFTYSQHSIELSEFTDVEYDITNSGYYLDFTSKNAPFLKPTIRYSKAKNTLGFDPKLDSNSFGVNYVMLSVSHFYKSDSNSLYLYGVHDYLSADGLKGTGILDKPILQVVSNKTLANYSLDSSNISFPIFYKGTHIIDYDSMKIIGRCKIEVKRKAIGFVILEGDTINSISSFVVFNLDLDYFISDTNSNWRLINSLGVVLDSVIFLTPIGSFVPIVSIYKTQRIALILNNPKLALTAPALPISKTNLSLWPNPIKSTFYTNIEIGSKYQVFNQLGQLMAEGSITTNNEVNLPNGLYYFKAINQDGNLILKEKFVVGSE